MSNPTIGILEWFRPGEYDRVELVLADLKTIGVQHLRTGVSWADWHTQSGQEWYTWLLPRLAMEVNLLPCFLYTPPSLGIVPKIAAPPREPKAYADFLHEIITRFGKYFEWVELWNEPNNVSEWDWTLDPQWCIFTEMVGGAAYWCRHLGKKTVLAGMSPIDPHWLKLMCDKGVMAYIDAVGIHGFPGNWEYAWEGWQKNVAKIAAVLENYNSKAEIWISETGFSTWRHDEHGQLREFVKAISAPVKRVYWYGAYDLHPNLPTIDGFHTDDREYHFGFKQTNGTPKLLFRLWASGGLEAINEFAQEKSPEKSTQVDFVCVDAVSTALSPEKSPEKSTQVDFVCVEAVSTALSPPSPPPLLTPSLSLPILITGGAGFIGTNLAHRLLTLGQRVVLFDNLSRPSVEQNFRWLRQIHGDLVQIEIGDVRDRYALRRALKQAQQVYHLAAQVAVTTSITNPMHDFEVNALGTLNLLEELRSIDYPPSLVFTSTNKVYGSLEDVQLSINCTRYQPILDRLQGLGEDRHLDFHSPYGCSKGAADQYVIDYANTFNIPAVVLRMSCIYGPHQFGTEDQGWVAHFLIRAIAAKLIILYGDGRQVRDVLFVEDLVDALMLAQENIGALAGQAFNIGGGIENTTSLLEFIELIGEIHGKKPEIQFEDWRLGDQRYYVSDTRKFAAATGWTPKVSIREGVEILYRWLNEIRTS